MLARLVLNSWPQVIHLLQPPKVLGLQAGATMPDPFGHVFIHFGHFLNILIGKTEEWEYWNAHGFIYG